MQISYMDKKDCDKKLLGRQEAKVKNDKMGISFNRDMEALHLELEKMLDADMGIISVTFGSIEEAESIGLRLDAYYNGKNGRKDIAVGIKGGKNGSPIVMFWPRVTK